MKPVTCPGCIYSGQPHLVGCEEAIAVASIIEHHKRSYEWRELMGAVNQLKHDEIPVVTAYVNRFIESRPKVENKS